MYAIMHTDIQQRETEIFQTTIMEFKTDQKHVIHLYHLGKGSYGYSKP